MLDLLDPAVPHRIVFARLKRRWRSHQRSEFDLCVGLRRLFRDKVHRGSSSSRFSTFVTKKLGVPEKLVWTFSALGEHFERLPLLAEALRTGEVPYTKAREFARWIDAKDQEEWIENVRAGGEFMNLLPDFFCDCEDGLHRRDECPERAGGDPDGPAGDPATRRYLPALERRVIEARDGYRCRTPGCENPVPLDDGHLGTPFRDGVPMSREYVGKQCRACNSMVESGTLVVVGRAPFEKYYAKDGTFLGFGFDPMPWSRLSHVGQPPRNGKSAVPPPDPRGKDPG